MMPYTYYNLTSPKRASRLSVLLCVGIALFLLTACGNQKTPPTAPPVSSPPAQNATTKQSIRFEDITAKAGIDFLHQNSKTPDKYMVETMGAGCAFIDYDGDGWLDILLLNGTALPGGKVVGRPTMRLYKNNKNLTFRDVTAEVGLDKADMYAMGVAVGDYDNDGKQDLYVSCVLGPSYLYHNEGGKFRDVTSEANVANTTHWGTSCAWVDYDKDGRLDLFVCNYVKYRSLKDDLPCFVDADHKRIYCIPGAYEAVTCTLFHNEGNGRFKDVTQASGIGKATGKGLGITVWDYDDDGYPDLFVACDTVPGLLFHNLKNGTFEELGVVSGVGTDNDGGAHSGMGIDADDVFNDGKMALAITNYQAQKTSFYVPTEVSVFNDIHTKVGIADATLKVLGFGVLFCDFDNDGWKDMAQVNGHVQDDIESREKGTPWKQPTLLFQNQGTGRFEEVGLAHGMPFTKPIVGRACAWGDIDNDGRPDLLITENGGKAMLWHNTTATTNHWLILKLKGKQSNRDGIGALVSVSGGGIKQRTTLRSGSSYLSQSDLRVRFGLGAEQKVNLTVQWTNGTLDKIENVQGDHIYTLEEGSGVLKTP